LALPEFFIIGAPKAGTTALHAALATHPQIFMSNPKEPKFYLYGGSRPIDTKGPGDAHGTKESVWQRDRYEALFANAPAGTLRGESTAFYLQDPKALARIRQEIPDAKLIAIIRDPVDRAYSNWLHLWADGLEPIGDFVTAFEEEDRRIAAGWGFFWHYRRLGRYGEQLAQLLEVFPREQLYLLRYRDLVDQPVSTLNSISDFLSIERDLTSAVPAENTRQFVPLSLKTRTISPLVRAGATVGAYFPPQIWRAASVPLLRALQHGGGRRPDLSVETRRQLVAHFAADIALLEEITGDSYSDWLSDRGRGEFSTRRQSTDSQLKS
jgi:hypothetical protein